MTPRSHYTEAAFQRQVEAMLTLYGWKWYHTHDSRRSMPGFPDVIALRGSQLLVLELKVGKRKATPEQLAWLQAFAALPGVWSGIVRHGDDIAALEALLA